MTLPSREDINVFDSLDERVACRHFLGKDLDAAEALFRENSAYFEEDLLWMGPTAFRFYVEALIRYLRSDASEGDAGIVSCFAGILEFRLENASEELRPIAPRLALACGDILRDYGRFQVDPEIWGDVGPRYSKLEQAFLRQIHGES
jgi:hypothetical protein